MATNTVGIDKEVEVDRKENLRDHRLYWIGRRTQDVILSSLALVVLSPVMLATAIAIVVDDPSAGPVFSQERIAKFIAGIHSILAICLVCKVAVLYWIIIAAA